MTDRLTENMTERLVIAAYAASTDAAYTIGTELTKYLQTGTRGKEEEEEKKKEKKRHRECEEKLTRLAGTSCVSAMHKESQK